MKNIKRILASVCACALCALGAFALSGCGEAGNTATTLRIGVLKGPTAIGLVDLMQRSENNETQQTYEFTFVAQADELVNKMISKDLDIALLPSANAANLYQKTKENTDGSAIQAISINTLNTLYGVSVNGAVSSLGDLAGKTVYMSGKGTTPEYVVEALLDQANMRNQVTLEFVSEPTEGVAKLQANPNAVAILPQPFATAAVAKVTNASASLDIGACWKAAFGQDQDVVTALTVARKELLDQNPESIKTFLADAKDSCDAVLANPEQAAAQVVSKDIVSSAAVAENAIPFSGITCITGSEMKSLCDPFFTTLQNYDSASLGGEVPSAEFYYIAVEE